MKPRFATLRVGVLILIGVLLVSGSYWWTRTPWLYSTRNRGIYLVGPSRWTFKKVEFGDAGTIISLGPLVLYDLAPDTQIEWQ
jgi:hypothetical protein